MKVYWLERKAVDVPSNETWLSAIEIDHLRALRFAKRRADWLLGRWTAKNAVAAYFGLSAEPKALADIEVRQQPSGAPKAFLQSEPMCVSISLSHRAGLAACAVAPVFVRLGCDLEVAEPHSDAFLTDYFTPEEQAMTFRAEPANRTWLLSLLWSAKESALKALEEGLRLDTRCLTVYLPDADASNKNGSREVPRSINGDSFDRNRWNRIRVHKVNAEILNGWWNQAGTLLRTLVAVPDPAPPDFFPS